MIAVPKDANTLDVLAQRYRAAFDKVHGGREQWIEGTLELAVVMKEAKHEMPGHARFSGWLTHHNLEQLHPNDRAALVHFAEDLEGARKLLERSNSISWRVIWENRPRAAFTKNGKSGLRVNRGRKYMSGAERQKRIPTVMAHYLGKESKRAATRPYHS